MKEIIEKRNLGFENEKEIAALEEQEENAKFEKQKQDAELKNRAEKEKFLEKKFNEILGENPIVIYKEGEKEIFYKNNKMKEVSLNHDDLGVNVSFNDSNWIRVYTKDIMVSYSFDSKQEDYKMSKDSFDTILNIMHDAIEITACSEFDKDKMFQMVIDNFKNKIISNEDIEKIG